MKKLTLFPLMLTVALAGCGDDGGTDTDTGAGTDTGTDSGSDAGTDTTDDTTDTGTDEGSGTDTGMVDEICDNGADDDGDGDTDCDDSDCADVPACAPAEICDNGTDDDGDGLADCEDNDCFADAACVVECAAPNELRGGECLTPDWTADELQAGTYSYIRNLQVPPRNGEAACCFDFNGDGNIDNGLGLLVGALGALGGDIDVDALIGEALADDSIALLFQWTKLDADPSEHDFSVYLATNDVDGDGTPDQSFGDRADGMGVFQVQAASVDAYGSIVQFNQTTFVDDVLTAGPGVFRLSIPIATEDFSLDLDLSIQQATVQGQLADSDNGPVSVDPTFDDVEYGGIKLGGVVPLDQIFEIIEDLARDCECAGFTADPIITYGDNGTTYAVACAQTPTGDCEGQGTICENLGTVCSFLPSLPSLGLNDIDTDGNGVGDALSVGVRLSLTGAAVDTTTPLGD
ncbi:MAG: hypothetical protein H6698_03260 [Myxococcales bacterium]|nr:hypothetical protein [Myxococcales bacterium]MCB9519330.1 hypothetical protein [Myxococcales bacterium]MCB9530774.1 hypothetical protein [Myxococcales bacterium]MCB9533332.1 hypothetical protein [Myxococcales bacterium]